VTTKVLIVVGSANGSRGSALYGTMAKGSTTDRKKKNSRVSPCFLHLKILKRAFLGDMKQ
jgi:hypothetical protein